MARSHDSAPAIIHSPPPLPGWAMPNIAHFQDDSGFAAGAALLSLSTLIKAEPAYLGTLAERLALRVAAATNRSKGRPEDQDQIRDEWWLRPGDEALTPPAAVFDAWRTLTRLRGGSRFLKPDGLELLALQFGQPLARPADEVLAAINAGAGDIAMPPLAAAAAARAVYQLDPTQEWLAQLIADATLASRLGWERPLPLLALHIAAPSLRAGGNRRRIVPTDAAWPQAVTVAYALSAPTVIELAQDLARRTTALIAFAPKLRAKPSDQVVEALLSNACLAGSRKIAGMSDRAMRRICDRLTEAGVVRELTGRQTFRLYGL